MSIADYNAPTFDDSRRHHAVGKHIQGSVTGKPRRQDYHRPRPDGHADPSCRHPLRSDPPDPKLLDLLPAKIAINVTREVIGKELYLLNVGSMAQLLDSQSGKLLVRVMDARTSPDTTRKDPFINAGEMEKNRPVGRQPCQTAGGQSGALIDWRVQAGRSGSLLGCNNGKMLISWSLCRQEKMI
nr:DUF3313 domain-containing protein [Aeromonas fluvialis]